MRRPLFLLLMLLPLSATATPAPSNTGLALCKEFAQLSATAFTRRDQGVSLTTQQADWDKVIAGKKDAAAQRTLMGNILQYAYSPKARGVSPKQAKKSYFTDCRASLEE